MGPCGMKITLKQHLESRNPTMKQNPTPPHLTHATGAPVTDNLNIQTAGPRGPALLQDIWLIEIGRAHV